MARRFALAALCLVLAGCGGPASSPRRAAATQAEPASVVMINVATVRPPSAGTGWVYDARRGLVVTAYHVVNGAATVEANVGGRWQRAPVVAAAPCEDVALIALPDTRGLQDQPLAPARTIAAGERVTAGGFPTDGGDRAWRSATGRVRERRIALGPDLQGSDTPALDDLLVTTSVTAPGMSGGPVLDPRGRLVGQLFGDWTGPDGDEATFAVRVDRIRAALDGFEHGRAPGWVGTGLYFGPGGVEVTGLAGGLAGSFPHHGIVVTAIDGKPVGRTFASWCATVGAHRGRRASLTVHSVPGDAAGTIGLDVNRSRLPAR